MLIKNAIIFDGTGKKREKGDIRTKGETIVEIGKLSARNNEFTIDATGAYVTPGFVDILNHSDSYVTLFSNPNQESLLQQGITTILMGNCGSSLAPLADGIFVNSLQKWGNISQFNVNWLSVKEYFEELKKHSFGPNIATLVGHSTVRRAITRDEPRTLTQRELKQIEHMIEQGIKDGAFGVSTGLAYAHARNTSFEEIKLLMKIAKRNKALYSTHIRNESSEFLNAFKESLTLAKKVGVNIEFSHLKVMGSKFWNQFHDALALLEKTDKNINFDIYPYQTTASVLYTFLPSWASEGGKMKLLKNINNSKKRKKIIEDMKQDHHSYKDMIVAMGSVDKTFFGKSLSQIAYNQNTTPEEAALNMIVASDNRLVVFTETIDANNIIQAIQHPFSLISSDGVAYTEEDKINGEYVHPRYFGAMPKFLNEYVEEQNLLSWEGAIQKITSGPARKIGFKKRGEIKKGYFADLVIINPETFKDTSTFARPYKYPLGIKYVIVNGKIAVDNGKFTRSMNGKILKK